MFEGLKQIFNDAFKINKKSNLLSLRVETNDM